MVRMYIVLNFSDCFIMGGAYKYLNDLVCLAGTARTKESADFDLPQRNRCK